MTLGHWLANLADPAGPARRWPARPFAAGDGTAAARLLRLARRHNIAPVVCANFGRLAEADSAAISPDGETVSRLCETVRSAQLHETAQNMLVAATARQVIAAMEGLPVAPVKGMDFAALWGGLHLRRFTDTDLLVAPEALDEAANRLHGLGFRPVPQKHRGEAEWKWTRFREPAGHELVELHTDLVHDPLLRRGMRLDWRMHAGNGPVDNAARLVVAGLHGAASHLFGRLQYVLDAMMIARAGVDPRALRARAAASGATLPVATLLRLAVEIHGCEASALLARSLEPVPLGRIARRPVSSGMVLRAKDAGRFLFLPQRMAYRRLMGSRLAQTDGRGQREASSVAVPFP